MKWNTGKVLEGQPGQGDETAHLPKYERTALDWITIGVSYLFAPLGMVLAVFRLMITHHKNYRKAVNFSLLYHVFVSYYIEMMAFVVKDLFDDKIETSAGTLLGLLIMFAAVFLLPAWMFARYAAMARYKFTWLAKLYCQLIREGGIRRIGTLSDQTGQSEADVRRDLQYLQRYGLLDPGLQVAEGRSGDIEYTQEAAAAAETGGEWGQTAGPQPGQPKSIRCPGCGAQNTVSPGQSKACEYCGTTIPYI